MKFYAAMFLTIAAAALLVVGIVQATHGSYWLLSTGAAVYMLGLIKFGCQTH